MVENPANDGRVQRLLPLAAILLIVLLYMVVLRTNMLHQLVDGIRSLGPAGMALAILVQGVINTLPISGTPTSLLLLESYGPFWGGFCSWAGGMLGAIGGYYLAHWVAKPYLRGRIGRLSGRLESWLRRRETATLLLVRIVPVFPYHAINYVSGLLRVRFVPYLWTAAIGILAYTIAVSGLFHGLRHGAWGWGVGGLVVFVALLAAGWYYRRSSFPGT